MHLWFLWSHFQLLQSHHYPLKCWRWWTIIAMAPHWGELACRVVAPKFMGFKPLGSEKKHMLWLRHGNLVWCVILCHTTMHGTNYDETMFFSVAKQVAIAREISWHDFQTTKSLLHRSHCMAFVARDPKIIIIQGDEHRIQNYMCHNMCHNSCNNQKSYSTMIFWTNVQGLRNSWRFRYKAWS